MQLASQVVPHCVCGRIATAPCSTSGCDKRMCGKCAVKLRGRPYCAEHAPETPAAAPKPDRRPPPGPPPIVRGMATLAPDCEKRLRAWAAQSPDRFVALFWVADAPEPHWRAELVGADGATAGQAAWHPRLASALDYLGAEHNVPSQHRGDR